MTYKRKECLCNEFQGDIDNYGDWNFCPWCGNKTVEIEYDDDHHVIWTPPREEIEK